MRARRAFATCDARMDAQIMHARGDADELEGRYSRVTKVGTMSRMSRMSRASQPRMSRATRRGMSTARDMAGPRQSMSNRDMSKKSKRASGGKKGAKKAARASAIDDSTRESSRESASSETSLDERLSIEETSIAELEEESNASWS